MKDDLGSRTLLLEQVHYEVTDEGCQLTRANDGWETRMPNLICSTKAVSKRQSCSTPAGLCECITIV